jgi:hypothetical protein
VQGVFGRNQGFVRRLGFHTFNANFFIIALNASKTFLGHHLFNENGEGPMEILQGEKLDKVMDKF